ncbi:MAG: tetratricopeptide repeat protein [Phycisphaerae bacterium]|nr:tetratricopeptide repeat protein [Phycisphaerae bacterium]
MGYCERRQLSILLLLSLLCGGATLTWAADKGKSLAASNRRAVPSKKPAVADPCAPGNSTMQTDAAADPSRNSASALASLATRAKNQTGTSLADAERGNPLALKLWSSRVSVPEVSDDTETSLALQRLIRRVRTLTVDHKGPTEPSASANPQLTAEPPTPVATGTETPKPVPAEAVAATAPETTPTLSPKTLKTLEDLRKDPNRIRDPLETAELLFLSGRPTDAVPFYEEALRRTRAGDAASDGDRAWALFQLGNCFRETDIAKAQDAYMRLIAEYPDSPWTEMARAGGRFLTWYQSARPDQLTAARKP